MKAERQTLFANVLLPLAIPGVLTYRVPLELNEEITPGKRVVVPLGKRKLYAGIITDVSEKVPSGYEVKYILSILDDVPVITDLQLKFWNWVSTYYMCTNGEVMKAALPAALRLESESMIVLADSFNVNEVYDPNELILLNYLEKAGEISIQSADGLVGKNLIHKIIRSLYQKGAILLKEDLSDNYKAAVIKCVRILPTLTEKELRPIFDRLEKKGKKQLEALMALYTEGIEHKNIERSEFIRAKGTSLSLLNALEKKGIIEYHNVPKKEFYTYSTLPIPDLSLHQSEKYAELHKCLEKNPICLLFGVTSSGKTHLYFQLIQKTISEGKQVLFIVPEMALTAHLIERFRLYFGELIEVTHSGYSQNERAETWNNVREGKTAIVLAVRSGIFMPFKDLGLIVVDEEHETTLKQQDPAPRYHVRECAAVLASLHNAYLILGSATPSIESWQNAHSGKFGFVSLTERFGGALMPDVKLLNLSEASKVNRMRGPFSVDMIDALETVLERNKQAIIFQNRRGYVPITECSVCGWTPKCINCDVSLTFYHSLNQYKCNLCGFRKDLINACGACGSTRLKLMGYGTERLEEDLQINLPKARIARFDSEAVRTKKNLEKTIKQFEAGEIDILVGTQLLSKGLDFEGLEFVGVVQADHLINFPDFRSVERSYQTFVQVSGRAGRRNVPGNVLIQTYQPGHKVLQALQTGDIHLLYNWEIEERKKFHYPPFSRIIKIVVKHSKKEVSYRAADLLAEGLKKRLHNRVLGPEAPYISRIRNQYLHQILIKFDPANTSAHKLKSFITELINSAKSRQEFKQIYILADVDPYF